MRRLWSAVAKRGQPPSPPADTVIVHDPAARRPHDLDDPFFSQRVQARVANVIADAANKK